MLFNKEFDHGVDINGFSKRNFRRIMFSKGLHFVMFYVEIAYIQRTYEFNIPTNKVIYFCINVKDVLVVINETLLIGPN